MTLLWKEWNWQRLKKAMYKRRNPAVNGLCDKVCLELGEDTVTLQTVDIVLQHIGSKTIT